MFSYLKSKQFWCLYAGQSFLLLLGIVSLNLISKLGTVTYSVWVSVRDLKFRVDVYVGLTMTQKGRSSSFSLKPGKLGWLQQILLMTGRQPCPPPHIGHHTGYSCSALYLSAHADFLSWGICHHVLCLQGITLTFVCMSWPIIKCFAYYILENVHSFKICWQVSVPIARIGIRQLKWLVKQKLWTAQSWKH